MVFGLNSTTGAAILFGHTLVAKMSMTALFRIKLTDAKTPKEECDKIEKSTFYKRVWAAQLNEAEYSGILIPGLLYLALKGIEAPILSAMSVFGQAWYFWIRAFIGHSHEGGMDPPPYIPGALTRYFACGLMAYNIYKTAK